MEPLHGSQDYECVVCHEPKAKFQYEVGRYMCEPCLTQGKGRMDRELTAQTRPSMMQE